MPILISRVQAIKESIPIDDKIKIFWDLGYLDINRKLQGVNKKLIEILNKLLENRNIFEFLVLQLHIIQVEVFLNNILKPYLDKDLFIKNLEQHLPLIKSILKVAGKLDDEDILLQSYLIVGSYFKLMDLKKGREIYERGLKLAKKIDHQHYIRKFEYNIEHLGEKFKLFTINDAKKSLISTNIEIIKQQFSNIDSIEDSTLKGAIKLALEDLDPRDYMKFCKFIVIAYNPTALGITYGLYSLGWKTLGCIKKNVKIEPGYLKNLFDLFKEQYCKECEFRIPRSEDFDPPIAILEDMYKSINQMKNHYQIN